MFLQLTAIDAIPSELRDSRRYSGLMTVFEIFDNFHPKDNSNTRVAFSITSSFPAKKLIKLFEIIPLCQIKGFEKNGQAQNWYISATL